MSGKVEKLELDGFVYDVEAIEKLKETVVVLRDSALKAERFDYAVQLSHVHAVLSHYQSLIE